MTAVGSLVAQIRRLVDEAVTAIHPVAGGDTSPAFRVELASGQRLFAKTHPSPARIIAEAEGLRWLGQIVATPEVVAADSRLLVLDWVTPGQSGPQTAEATGRALAALHAAPARLEWGWGLQDQIGTLPQDNTPCDDWPTFWRDRRLAPQIALGARHIPGGLQRRLDRLLIDLPALLATDAAPARVHGDLWAGNRLIGQDGAPWFIDPAAFAGHREVDLAMMHLFGGFSRRCLDAYEEALPLEAGAVQRRPIYQLYFLLVHLNLFGPGWLPRIAAAVSLA